MRRLPQERPEVKQLEIESGSRECVMHWTCTGASHPMPYRQKKGDELLLIPLFSFMDFL
jgi:hypothetical protein